MSRSSLTYKISTGLFSALILLGVTMYLVDHDNVARTFETLGYPGYLVYPLALAKLLGLVAIWTRRSTTLKEWAYAGFFFDLVLAIMAHVAISDGEFAPAVIGLTLLLISHRSQRDMPEGT